MNGLSLRLSTVKGNENLKKNSEIRLELLKPPESTGNFFCGLFSEKFFLKKCVFQTKLQSFNLLSMPKPWRIN
jgi:hypothetical protein